MRISNSEMTLLRVISFLTLFHECLGTSELLTLMPDSTSGIKACNSAASCILVKVNFAAIGEEALIFPEGKVLPKRLTVENGYEYEVGNRYSILVCVNLLTLGFCSEFRRIRCHFDSA